MIEVVEAAGASLDVIVLPKVAAPDHVRWLDLLLGQLEQATGLEPGRIGIEAQIENGAAGWPRWTISRPRPALEALVFFCNTPPVILLATRNIPMRGVPISSAFPCPTTTPSSSSLPCSKPPRAASATAGALSTRPQPSHLSARETRSIPFACNLLTWQTEREYHLNTFAGIRERGGTLPLMCKGGSWGSRYRAD